jgi:MFS family permease
MSGAGSQPSVFRHRPFAFFYLSRVAGSLANQMQTVAVTWQMYQLTSNPFDLGLVGLAQFLPLASLMLVVGHVADRYDRKTIVRISQLVDGSAMTILAAGTAGGWLTRDLILAVVLIFGAARAFQQPSQQTLLPLIVPDTLLSRAVAASSSSNQIATIVGPAIGGLLFAVSAPLVYLLCAACYFGAAILTSLIAVGPTPPLRAPLSFQTVFAGITYIRRQPVVLGAITLDLFAVLLGGATALLPIFARDIFHTGPWGLGLLRLSPAVGALFMSALLARWPMHRHAGPIMFMTVTSFGAATIVFGLSRSFALSMIALAILGASDMISVVIRQTLIQLGTPNAMRGRVNAVNSLFIGTSNQLGEFRSGVMAGWFGTIPSVLIGGIGTLLVVAASLKLFPELARINSVEDVRKQVEETAES